MPLGDLITRWTVRLALACYFTSVLILLRSNRAASRRIARLIWTLGCIIFLAHVAAAFHFYHHWSHADALEATRAESLEVANFNSGLGLWLNYLFTLLWLLETIAWWRSNDQYLARPRRSHLIVHGFMLFMIVNATVIFETGSVRGFGLAGCLGVVIAALANLRRDKTVTK